MNRGFNQPLSRRRLLQAGGIGSLGLALPGLLRRLMGMTIKLLIALGFIALMAAATGPATLAIFLQAVLTSSPAANAPAKPALPDN